MLFNITSSSNSLTEDVENLNKLYCGLRTWFEEEYQRYQSTKDDVECIGIFCFYQENAEDLYYNVIDKVDEILNTIASMTEESSEMQLMDEDRATEEKKEIVPILDEESEAVVEFEGDITRITEQYRDMLSLITEFLESAKEFYPQEIEFLQKIETFTETVVSRAEKDIESESKYLHVLFKKMGAKRV